LKLVMLPLAAAISAQREHDGEGQGGGEQLGS